MSKKMKLVRRCLSMLLALAIVIVSIEYKPSKAAETTYTSGDYQYTLNEESEATITKYTGTVTSLVVPDTLDGKTVVAIGNDVFANQKSMVSVTLPQTLRSLGYHAFWNTGFTQVTIPKSLTSANASFENSKVTDAWFEEGSTQVAGRLFQGCKTLTGIHWENTITKIGGSAFHSTSVTKLDLPDGITSIGDDTFANCTLLTEVDLPDSIESLGYHAFWNTGFTQVTIPKSLTSANASFENSKVTDAWFEEGSTQVAGRLFQGCKTLTGIHWENTITKIGGSAFHSTSVTKLDLPDGITSIGDDAFANCTLLTEVDLPDSIESLGYHAFWNTGFTQVTIPKSLTSANASFENSKVTDAWFEEGSTQVARRLFQSCKTLTGIHWKNSITKIGGNAFNSASVTKLDLPDGITSIGDDAFANCTLLTEVDLPNSIESLGYHTFWNTGFTQVTIPKSLTSANASFANSKVTDVCFEEGSTQVVGSLFQGCTTLRNIKLLDEMDKIGKDAFSGCTGLYSMDLPISIKEIGAGAFSNCKNLKQVNADKKITSVGHEAFSNCPDLYIHTSKYTDSTISMIAAEQNVKFTDTNYTDTVDKVIHHEKCVFEVNDSSTTDYVMVNLDYALKNAMVKKVSDMKLIVKLPSSAEVISVKMDGATMSPDEYSLSDKNEILIPVTKQSGKIRIYTTPALNGRISGYARLTYKKGGVEGKDLIGAISEECACLTLGVNEQIPYKKGDAEASTTIRGYGVKGKNLEIYVNGVLADEKIISNTGKYSADIKLPKPENFKKYAIKVKSQNKYGNETELVKEVRTVENGPKLTGVSLYIEAHDYEGGHKTFDLLNDHDTIKYITFQKAKPYRFRITYENREAIDRVFVLSTRNGFSRKLEAIWDEEKNAYVTEGYFNNDPSYVPGNISVEYTAKTEETVIKEDGTILLTDREKGSIPDDWKNARAEQVTDTTDDFQAEITLHSGEMVDYSYNKLSFTEYARELEELQNQNPASQQPEVEAYSRSRSGSEDMLGTLIDVLKLFDESGTAETAGEVYELLEAYGFSRYTSTENNVKKDIALIKTECTPDAIQMYMIDPSSSENSILKYVIKKGKKQTQKTIFELLDIDGTAAGFVLDSASDMFEFGGQAINLMMMKQQVMSDPSLTQSQREEKLKEIQKMVDIACEKLIFNYLAGVIGVIGAMALPFSGVAIGCGIAVLVIKKCIIPMIESGDFDDFIHGRLSLAAMLIRWIIDPSGFVYEGVTSNRVQGATVTLYYKENKDSSNSILWEASDYDQTNPLVTDDMGTYAWDVPEGFWQVKVEKDGYEAASSDWLEVPPPQTDVLIELKRLEAPEITEFYAYDSCAKVSFSQYMDPDSVKNLVLQDAAGNSIRYTLSYNTDETNAEGRVYARDYTLVYSGTHPSGNVSLKGTGDVKSSSGVALQEVTKTDVSKSDINILCNDYVNLKVNDSYELEVKVTGNSQSELSAVVEHGTVVQVAGIENGNEAGCYKVSLKGLLYGETTLVLSVAGSGIKKELPIEVGNVTESGNVTEEGVLQLISDSSLKLSENGELTGILQNKNTVQEIRQQFANADLVMKDASGKQLTDSDFLGTGATVSIMDGATVKASCQVVFVGDVNGDGKVNGKDVSKLAQSLVGKATLTDAQKKAGEVFEDGKINGKDVSKLAQSLVGKATIPSQGK